MKKLRAILPLGITVVLIVTAILIIENPFSSGDSADNDADKTVVVINAPELLNLADTEPLAINPELEQLNPTPTRQSQVTGGPLAAELVGINAWINSQPLTLSKLSGKVVLVDFWTYTCVNCIRTLPYLKLWQAKYADDGLVIIGVHSPEFKFEEKLDNVVAAVKENGIGWAVAQDNDFATWKAYNNRYWPAKYLVDKDGVLRYKHFGEGAYAETESKIRELLKEAGADLSQLDASLPSDQVVDPAYLNDPSAGITRELYAGWDRGYGFGGSYVWNKEFYSDRDMLTEYNDPGNHVTHQIYLEGPWYNSHESLIHGRETTDFEDHIALKFSATSVNAVIRPEGEDAGPFTVLVELEGEYLTEANKGEDVVIEEDGRSFLHVEESRMYSIIQVPSYGTYEMRLSSNSPHFALFAFTFGIYESGI